MTKQLLQRLTEIDQMIPCMFDSDEIDQLTIIEATIITLLYWLSLYWLSMKWGLPV